jgi:hypothetical protein
MSEGVNCETISVKPIKYYQKPVIGNDTSSNVPPIQLVFQGGGFGLGVAAKEHNVVDPAVNREYPVILSGPEFSDWDELEKRGLQLTFLVLAVVNLVVTCLMFIRADTVDPSKVEPSVSSLPEAFELVASLRRQIEVNNFAFVILTLLIGTSSVLLDIPLGISAYAFSVVLNFLLGTSALPYFVYSLRYILDVFMLYIALVHRSRLTYTFLPVRVRR